MPGAMPNLFGESPRRSPCPANQFLPVRFLSGHCADAHDAHPPRRRPRAKHHSRLATMAATASPMAATM
jgi:hypothetical protein